jgi:hypothetical protein
MIYNCPNCKAPNESEWKRPAVIICRTCHTPIRIHLKENVDLKPTVIPEDWTFLQLQSTAEYGGKTMKLVGRIRLQLRNDYKNVWCGAFDDGSYVWLMESFASFIVLKPEWAKFHNDVRQLHTGENIKLGTNRKVKGEYVEKCEGVSYEGELGDWRLFYPNFFFIQAASSTGDTAIFIVDAQKNIEYLSGEKIEVEKLNLKNIIVWDEWK